MNDCSKSTAELFADVEEELDEFFDSELLSEDDLREIIERYELTPNNTLSDYDFFISACCNERVTESIIRCLLEYFPDAVAAADEDGWSALHFACMNNNVTLKIIQLLIDAAPASVRSVNNKGVMPLHALCINENVQVIEAAIRCILEYFPAAAGVADDEGMTPLHVACKNASLNSIRLLVEAAPDSVRSPCNGGYTPLHRLCMNRSIDKAEKNQILKYLLDKHPEAVRHATNGIGRLPIHYAGWYQSPEFCRVLIEACPGSEQMATHSEDKLPLHYACWGGTLCTVEYLYKLYPAAINHATNDGDYPIHVAIMDTCCKEDPMDAVKVFKFILGCYSNSMLKKFRGRRALLRFACRMPYNDSHIEAGIKTIEAIYNAHPEAIEDEKIAKYLHRRHWRVQEFIKNELVYVRLAKDQRLRRRMTTPDGNGQLPLHRALVNNAALGSIKLLIEANPQAVQSPDNSGALPLHIACQHRDSVNVVQYLVELDTTTLDAVDRVGNTLLHYACRDAGHEIIAMLLEKFDAVSVSKRNAQNKLPIDLLWESNAVEDRESVEYTDSVFRLLQVYPEMIMNYNAQDQAKTSACSSQNEKKRKLDAV